MKTGQSGGSKKQGATDFSVAPRLVPSPRYFANFRLQLRPRRTGADRIDDRRCTVVRRVGMDHAVFVGAEAAHARLVEGCGRSADGVPQVRDASRDAGYAEVVAALVKSDCGGLR